MRAGNRDTEQRGRAQNQRAQVSESRDQSQGQRGRGGTRVPGGTRDRGGDARARKAREREEGPA